VGAAKRLVVKVGSAVLSKGDIGLHRPTLERISRELSALREEGREIVLVSSGAILAGMGRLGLGERPGSIPLKQAAAAVGQSLLMRHYEEAFDPYGQRVAQLLLTQEDFRSRPRYLNARNTLFTLLHLGVLPIINENDTVSVEEIRFGDNDNLSALVATLVGADLLVILTDLDGLYTADPRRDPNASLITRVPRRSADVSFWAADSGTGLGTGGMVTKMEAARRAAASGIPTIIANGLVEGILARILRGEAVGTLVQASSSRMRSRKRWLAFATQPRGRIAVDIGAKEALIRGGKSLLPSGVVSASGALMILCTWRAGRYLGNGHGLGIALLILSGGFLRILAGHLEVYAFVLAAAAAFLWSSLAFQSGRGHWATPCLALGFAVWLHPSALALVPSLVFLLHSAEGSRPLKRVVLGLVIASLPWLLFAPVLLSASHHDALEQSREVFLQVLGLSDDPKTVHRWVRGWGGGPGVGTDYVFLSLPHLKYLVNAFHLLCAWAAPALLLLVSRPTRFLSTPTARFLTAASLPLVAYALVLRPVWGPFDWDLFSITGLFLASLSAHLLATSLSETTFRHVVVWLAGFNLLFVGLPLLAVGFVPALAAGPFALEASDPEMMIDPTSPRFSEIAPWL